METILITGGSGLIGSSLTRLLRDEKYKVTHLTTRSKSGEGIYKWDPAKKYIDMRALQEADHIIHLAGANVAALWTPSYKKKILSSRVQSAGFILEMLAGNPNHVRSFISSSAVGYYGNGGEEWLTEQSPSGTDFLSEVCAKWELAALKFESLNKRVAIFRTGIVLAKGGGTLPALLNPLRFGIAPVFGNGSQWYPWIHIADLCRMYSSALKNENIGGIYNGVAPSPVRFIELIHAISRATGKRKIDFPVPAFLLRTFLDGFGNSLLSSSRCSSEKIEAAGFRFDQSELDKALKDLV